MSGLPELTIRGVTKFKECLDMGSGARESIL